MSAIKINISPRVQIPLYIVILMIVSGYILVIFVRPIEGVHGGLNNYYRSKFMEMVSGNAYRPYVYRTLLPSSVRFVSLNTPDVLRQYFTTTIKKHVVMNDFFQQFNWETSAAYEYTIAMILMLISFMGFAHFAAKLTIVSCNIVETLKTRLLFAIILLLGLPPFFRYTSYPYDPPQLMLFTMSLFLLATSRYRAFFITFCFCCVNKETAILLILIFGFTRYKSRSSIQHYWGIFLGLFFCYLGIRSFILYIYRLNPGSVVEFHLVRNLDMFTRGWNFVDSIILLILAFLIFFRWKGKPEFLKTSLLLILIPSFVFALFLGYFDEWRSYFEAYPVAFALIIYSLIVLRKIVDQNKQTAEP